VISAHHRAVSFETLRPTLERAGDGAFVIGANGRIVLWNRAAERLLGYTSRDVVGRPCCDVFVGTDGSGNRLCYQGCHVMNLIRLDEPVQSFDMRTRTKTGRPVWLNISILSVRGDPAGACTVHLFRDVTPRASGSRWATRDWPGRRPAARRGARGRRCRVVSWRCSG
jgi:PAS domain S-box-containing protein